MSTATFTTSAVPRFDLYGPIHKALRAFMGDTLVSVGRMDAGDDAEVEAALEQTRSLMAVMALHLEDENRFVHTAMEARRKGSSARTAHDHRGHETALAELGQLIERVAGSAGVDRAEEASRLYRRLALFVAENLEHMSVEERDNASVLLAEYSDPELIEIETAIVSSVPPELMAITLPWMIRALSHPERAARLAEMRQTAPPQVFERALAMARSVLGARDWAKLEDALALRSVQAA